MGKSRPERRLLRLTIGKTERHYWKLCWDALHKSFNFSNYTLASHTSNRIRNQQLPDTALLRLRDAVAAGIRSMPNLCKSNTYRTSTECFSEDACCAPFGSPINGVFAQPKDIHRRILTEMTGSTMAGAARARE